MFVQAHQVRHTCGTMRSNAVDGGHGQTLLCAEVAEQHATGGHSVLHEDPEELLQCEDTTVLRCSVYIKRLRTRGPSYPTH